MFRLRQRRGDPAELAVGEEQRKPTRGGANRFRSMFILRKVQRWWSLVLYSLRKTIGIDGLAGAPFFFRRSMRTPRSLNPFARRPQKAAFHGKWSVPYLAV
jgi:hypothetical protein